MLFQQGGGLQPLEPPHFLRHWYYQYGVLKLLAVFWLNWISLETRSFVYWQNAWSLVQEFHGPIINHTGCARPHIVMNIVMSHMNLKLISNSVECSTIMIFMAGCGRVVNYRSMKFLDHSRRSVSKRTAWSRGYSWIGYSTVLYTHTFPP